MASNLFGNPITDSTLERMPEYKGKTITRADLALVAEVVMQNPGTPVFTFGILHNLSGGTVNIFRPFGHFGFLPSKVANKQWGVFAHQGAAAGSSAGIVFKVQNEFGKWYDWIMAWSNPDNKEIAKKAYTEIRNAKPEFTESDFNDDVHNKMLSAHSTSTWTAKQYGYQSTVTINDCGIFKGTLALNGHPTAA